MPLVAVPNVTAHRSTANVLITVLLYNVPLLCGLNVLIKGLTRCWHVTISCQPDGRPPQPVRPWKSGRIHLAEGSNVVVLEKEIRSVELGVCPMQLFHFLIMS